MGNRHVNDGFHVCNQSLLDQNVKINLQPAYAAVLHVIQSASIETQSPVQVSGDESFAVCTHQ